MLLIVLDDLILAAKEMEADRTAGEPSKLSVCGWLSSFAIKAIKTKTNNTPKLLEIHTTEDVVWVLEEAEDGNSFLKWLEQTLNELEQQAKTKRKQLI